MTPLERAARALFRLQDGPTQELLDRLSPEDREYELRETQALEDATWPKYVADVRVVLTAIREPSEGMIAAGADVDEHPIGTQNAPTVYQAMIDAALAE